MVESRWKVPAPEDSDIDTRFQLVLKRKMATPLSSRLFALNDEGWLLAYNRTLDLESHGPTKITITLPMKLYLIPYYTFQVSEHTYNMHMKAQGRGGCRVYKVNKIQS
ncbi:hypothetical protein PILCRDRAFT_394035 [Piloderma croceum F 1598]|uniref:Uncharacterized protein n=1 Tax=Piloderma croceum (strain F 1598) TaxID=765440 RepID=A0A0C3G289_PILCF|nr:hypothetical protein PILCRDRAFT_394035 [Piloderma croceum F 1598]